MKPDLALRIILGPDLFRETQLLAGGRESVADVVRVALRRFLDAGKAAAPTSNEESPGVPRPSQRSREGPDAPFRRPQGRHSSCSPHSASPPRSPKGSSPRPEPESFSCRGCTFLWGDSLQILDDKHGEVTIPLAAAVAFLLRLGRSLNIAILELLLSPEDFTDIESPKPD